MRIVHGEETHVCVPLQGSGTFSVEAAIGTVVPRDGHVLVPSNGAYCQRIARICKYLGRRHTVIDYTEDRQVLAVDVDLALDLKDRLTPLFLALGDTPDPAAVKHGLAPILGLAETVRLPLVAPTASAGSAVRRALAGVPECVAPLARAS